MKIVSYDQLRDPHAFLQLMETAFWWLVTPERVEELRRTDPRLRDNYGFGMLSGKDLIGFVGVMDLPVKTRDGKTETAVGIHHVATHPGYARRGIAARLLEHVHDFYRRRGYRFAFLFTSRSLVAWSLYRKLGYEDIGAMGRDSPRAERIFQLSPGRKPRRNATLRADLGRVEQLFEEAMRKRTGFAVRPKGWIGQRLKMWRMKPSSIIVDRDGYAFTEPEKDGIWILEFLARSRAAYLRILSRVLSSGRSVVCDCLVYDPVLKSIYRQKGFRFRYVNYGTLMAKPLAGTSIRRAFGRTFFWTPVDQF